MQCVGEHCTISRLSIDVQPGRALHGSVDHLELPFDSRAIYYSPPLCDSVCHDLFGEFCKYNRPVAS